MNPNEQLAHFGKQAESSAAFAREQTAALNPFGLANWGSAARNHFMRALIGWRTNLLDPEPDLASAVAMSREAVRLMRTVDVGLSRYLFEPVPGAFSSMLLGQADDDLTAEAMRSLAGKTPGVTEAAIAEGWLVSALGGGDPGPGPDLSEKLAAAKRTSLWGRSLQVYFQLLEVPATEPRRAWDLTRRAVDLFGERSRNGYFSAGQPYYGGGPDNGIVIDFHLASIWQLRRWDHSGLEPETRLHAVRPGA